MQASSRFLLHSPALPARTAQRLQNTNSCVAQQAMRLKEVHQVYHNDEEEHFDYPCLATEAGPLE